jgi:DNA-directed RNA polymerase specialized sigma24 family protein
MIPYINGKLDQWGQWVAGGRERLGYPKQAAFVRLVPTVGASQVLICDDEAMEINRAVQSLDADLRRVVDLFYVKMRSCDGGTIAKSLGCCRDTLYSRLHRAHVKVMEAMQDEWLEAGG